MKKEKEIYVGIDAGGTHTDAVVVYGGEVSACAKVRTQHDNLPASIQEALCTLQERMQTHNISLHHAQRITLGTTLAINALVQNALPPVGLFLTAGPGIHPLNAAMGEHVVLVGGGLDHRGQEITPLDAQAIREAAHEWHTKGIRHFAVVGKFSPRNAAHELAIASIINEVTPSEVHVTLGHEMSGLLNFPRRVASAWFNAAVRDVLCRFLDAVEMTFHNMDIHAPLYLLKADGGSMPAGEARRTPVNALLSGPAASAMGLMASKSMMPHTKAASDVLLLDIGGTTTDMAVFVGGVPVLERDGMQLALQQDSPQGQQRKTHMRALATLSLPVGGDSVLHVSENDVHVGPRREGAAVAFGGEKPTLLDALLLLYDDASIEAAARQKSRASITALADAHGLSATVLAKKAVECACEHIFDGITSLLQRLNGQPVYTIAQLLEGHVIQLDHVFLVGAPAHIIREALTKKLAQHLDVTVSVPEYASVMNGLGAALTAPTAHLELFVDSIQNVRRTSPGVGHDKFSSPLPASLEAACAQAVIALQQRMNNDDTIIDIVEAQCFSILDNSGHSGKDMRVRCQVRPHIVA